MSALPVTGTLPTSLQIAVEDPRPLAAAADEMGRRFGIAVSYEDPPYSDPVDLVYSKAIEFGLVPLNLLSQSTVALEGGALTAREHLAALSAALPYPVTWRLLYHQPNQTYYLSLLVVPANRQPVLTVQPPAQDAASLDPTAGGGG